MKFFLPLSLILISGLLFFFIVDPMYKDVSGLRTNVATYNVALNNSTELQKTRDELVDVYKNIKREDKERLLHFLPNTVNNIRFILEIEQIASLHNMPIENIKFQNQDAEAAKVGTTGIGTVISSNNSVSGFPYGTFPVEFTTTGTYSAFTSFLKDVEHNLRLVDVKSVNFTVPSADVRQAGVDPNVYTFLLKVETYWLK